MRRLHVLVGLLAIGVAGCERDLEVGGPREKRDYKALAKPRGLKPPEQLQVPEDLTGPVQDARVAKQGWEAYRTYKPGTFAEYELPNGTLRRELYDLADHAATDLTTVAVQTGSMNLRQRSAVRLLFTEPEGDWPPPPQGDEVLAKPDQRKVKVGETEVETDMLYEVKAGGKTTRVWVSSQVPLGGVVLIEDAEGKALQKLTDFGGPE